MYKLTLQFHDTFLAIYKHETVPYLYKNSKNALFRQQYPHIICQSQIQEEKNVESGSVKLKYVSITLHNYSGFRLLKIYFSDG